MLLDEASSLEVRFGDHPVDFIVPLSIGGFSRILVDFSVRVSVDWLSVGFDLSVGLDLVDTAISLFENSLLRRRLLHQIDCRLPSWLGRM